MKKNNIKEKILLLSYLALLGISTLNNNSTVRADEVETTSEENNTVNNKSNSFETYDDKINYFSNVFGINPASIYDYLDYMYNENNDNEDFLNMNKDLQILTAARHIYYSDDYNDSFTRTNKEYEVTMEIEEMVEMYSEIYEINKEVALSIVYCECGSNVNSYNYLNNNNPAGLGPYMHFENKEIGVIYFIDLLKNGYGCTKDSGKEFLSSIASTYCEIPDHWLDLTIPFYNNLSEDYYYMKPELHKNDGSYIHKSYTYKEK